MSNVLTSKNESKFIVGQNFTCNGNLCKTRLKHRPEIYELFPKVRDNMQIVFCKSLDFQFIIIEKQAEAKEFVFH